MIRRISLWGGPGSGKSTVTPWLFSQLKMAGKSVEHVSEFAKRWACQKRPIQSFDQMLLTSQQINAEDEFLRSGVELIITDAPPLIGYVYGSRNGLHYAPVLLEMGRALERDYPSVNVFLERDIPYRQDGRYESEREADATSALMLGFLHGEFGVVARFPTTRHEDVLEHLLQSL